LSNFKETGKGIVTWILKKFLKVSFADHAKGKLTWKLEKFKAKDGKEILQKGVKPYQVIEREFECLLNEGIGNFIDLICGLGSPTAWNNANARIGVGNDATAPSASQTGLLGASKLYKGMNAGYPQKSGQQSIFQGDFIDGEAEFAWLEEAIDNGAVALIDICRQNTSLGTKPAGQTWRLTGTITWS
jgi:hypothetical protein